MIRSMSASVIASGFSQKTCNPVSSAVSTISTCVPAGDAISTASRPPASISERQSACEPGIAKRAHIASRTVRDGSASAAISKRPCSSFR